MSSDSDLKRVFVVSAASGAGKTTLNRMLASRHPDIEIAVSLTTRSRREGEIEGKHYFFVDESEFRSHIDAKDMLEWANVHGNLYGTSKRQLKEIESRGHYSLLEIDVQGWETARKKLRKATSIFILPPTMKQLWERLSSRGTDDKSAVWQRFCNARDEILHAEHYDHFIINDDLERAYSELEAIVIRGESGSVLRQLGIQMAADLVEEFDSAEWVNELKSKF